MSIVFTLPENMKLTAIDTRNVPITVYMYVEISSSSVRDFLTLLFVRTLVGTKSYN